MERKLAAILSADVKGYSRLMGEDDEATIRTLTAYRAVMTTLIEQHHGRVVDSPGDNLLAEFASAVNAVQGAVAIQQELTTRNAKLPPNRQLAYRIGVNLGDIVTENGRVYGDGVNIAARLEALADAGGICISGKVLDEVRTKLPFEFDYLGEREVKNIANPVPVYKVQLNSERAASSPASPPPLAGRPVQATGPARRWPLATVTVVAVLLVSTGLLVYRTVFSPFSPRLPLPDKPSIAVLPLTNMSGDPAQEYFSDGLTEDIITDLSQISGLFVIARNSTFTYKGQAVNVQEIGREFGVRYVLEGSTRKAADRVRVTAQLVEAATSHHLWAKNYDRPLRDIFAVQDDIVQQIGAALRVEVLEAEQARVRHIPTENLTAYDNWLRGLEYWWRLTQEGNVQARQLFERAIALDPQYAEAYAWLGSTYLREWVLWNQDSPLLERAGELTQQALALDDSLPDAHSFLGYIYLYQKQPEQAIAEAERAVALDSNNADAYHMLADILTLAGRPAEALGLAQQAIRLNPRGPPSYPYVLGMAYTETGQYAKAIAAFKDTLRRDPNYYDGIAYGWLAISYLNQWSGQWSHDPQTLDHQFEAAQRVVALGKSMVWFHGQLSAGYVWQKRYAEALTAAEQTAALAPHDPVNQAYLGNVLNFVGRPTETLERLEPVNCATAIASGAAFCFLVRGDAYLLTRRYAEAIAAYQQALRHHPSGLGSNRLLAHVGLAASYSALGQMEEARAEVAEVLQTNPDFSLAVWQQRVPYTDPAVIERLASALRQAGLE